MKIAFFSKTLEAYDAHIDPIIRRVPEKELEFCIFHLNSIYAPDYDKDRIDCKLVEFSSSWNISKSIKLFDPDVMIFYNPGHIFELYLTEICYQLGVIPIFFQHGLSIDLTSFDIRSLSQNKSLARSYIIVRKYLFFFLSIFLNLLWIKNHGRVLKYMVIKCYYLFIGVFRKSRVPLLPKYGLKQIHCEYAFVYGERDRKYLVDSMNMKPDSIIISGYPFLAPTTGKSANRTSKTVLLLPNPYRATGDIAITKDQEKAFYLALYNQVSEAGFNLIIKLHPKDNLSIVKQHFNAIEDVAIYQNKNLADLTIIADIVISDFSTALFYPIKYKKPIIILTSKYFEKYPFEYTDYGIGYKSELSNLSENINYGMLHFREQDSSYDQFTIEFLLGAYNQDAYSIFYSKIGELIKEEDELIKLPD